MTSIDPEETVNQDDAPAEVAEVAEVPEAKPAKAAKAVKAEKPEKADPAPASAQPQRGFKPATTDITGSVNTRNGGGGHAIHTVTALFNKPASQTRNTAVTPVRSDVIPGVSGQRTINPSNRVPVSTDLPGTFETRSDGAAAEFDPVNNLVNPDAVAAAKAAVTKKDGGAGQAEV